MQLKNLLTKSLLVAGMLAGASNAWAEDTPYNITSTESAYVDATDAASKAATHNGASLDNLIVYYTQTRNWKVSGNTCNTKFNAGGKMALYKFPLSSIKSETGTLKSAIVKVTINSTGDGKNVSKLGIFGYNGSQDWTGATLTYNNLANTGANDLGYTVDYSASYPILDVNSHDLGGGADAVVSASALTYVQSAITAGKDYVSFAVSNNSTRTTNLNVAATLELVFSSAAATTYTIQYQNAGGDELKTAVVHETFEGESFTASSAEIATFYNNDYTKKYTYVSGNSTETAVASAASNIITLIFEESANSQFTHTINATGAITKDGIASITLYQGQTGTVYYNKYISDAEGNWYSTATNGNSGTSISYGVSASENGTTNKSYSASTITDFIEVENLNKSRSWATEGTANRLSNGKGPRLAQGGYAFTEPIAAGGTFNITLGARGVADNATVNLFVGTKVNNSEVSDMVSKGTFSKWDNGTISEITIENVVIEPGQVIVIKNPSDDNNCYVEADYICLTKTADYTVSKTISAAGWATYCSPYALDLANATGLTDAYIVTGGAGGVLSKMSVKDGTVPANTGLLLKADAGTVTIPVVASSSTDVSDNKLVGKTAEYALAAEGGYVLMATGSNGLGFYKNSNEFTVGANTAYLPANFDGALAPEAFFSFLDGETTGISGVGADGIDTQKEGVFNLNGQRVAQPTKGLYIVGGKKVLFK